MDGTITNDILLDYAQGRLAPAEMTRISRSLLQDQDLQARFRQVRRVQRVVDEFYRPESVPVPDARDEEIGSMIAAYVEAIQTETGSPAASHHDSSLENLAPSTASPATEFTGVAIAETKSYRRNPSAVPETDYGSRSAERDEETDRQLVRLSTEGGSGWVQRMAYSAAAAVLVAATVITFVMDGAPTVDPETVSIDPPNLESDGPVQPEPDEDESTPVDPSNDETGTAPAEETIDANDPAGLPVPDGDGSSMTESVNATDSDSTNETPGYNPAQPNFDGSTNEGDVVEGDAGDNTGGSATTDGTTGESPDAMIDTPESTDDAGTTDGESGTSGRPQGADISNAAEIARRAAAGAGLFLGNPEEDKKYVVINGDVTGDGVMDEADLEALTDALVEGRDAAELSAGYDVTGDGRVDAADAEQLRMMLEAPTESDESAGLD